MLNSTFVVHARSYTNTIQWNPSNPDTNGPKEESREVSLFQGLKSTQTWLERCPYFRGVLIEGFHCITIMCNFEDGLPLL